MEFKLILKKIDHTLSNEEKVIFEDWYHESEEHRAYFKRIQENYSKGLDVVDIQKGWNTVSSKIGKKRKNHQYWKYASAVAALLILGSVPFLLNDRPESSSITTNRPVKKNTPITVGTDKALLTLEDGTNVTLEKGKTYGTENISSNGSQLIYSSVSKGLADHPVYNELTIPRGGQFFLSLVDGTKVWLNSASKLRYPITFPENSPREVELVYGEAYFDVSPSSENNDTHFMVVQQDQTIEVWGTEFNIRAYQEDAIVATTLVEGKVVLKKGPTSKNLFPGQQSRSNMRTAQIDIVEVDIYNEISWKNGHFSFENKSLENIMLVLSRWYDINVEFLDESIKDLKFSGVFRKSQAIDEILMILENTNEVNYSISEKTIIME